MTLASQQAVSFLSFDVYITEIVSDLIPNSTYCPPASRAFLFFLPGTLEKSSTRWQLEFPRAVVVEPARTKVGKLRLNKESERILTDNERSIRIRQLVRLEVYGPSQRIEECKHCLRMMRSVIDKLLTSVVALDQRDFCNKMDSVMEKLSNVGYRSEVFLFEDIQKKVV